MASLESLMLAKNFGPEGFLISFYVFLVLSTLLYFFFHLEIKVLVIYHD